MIDLILRRTALLLATLLMLTPVAAFAQTPTPETGGSSPAGTVIEEPVSEESPEPVEVDNAAVAVNETDGAGVFDFAFDVIRVTDGIVDQTNLALAYSSCEACTTVAVAVQIVLVVGEATVVTPQNVAIAVNYECTLCETFAMAYQFVIGIGEGPIHITGPGQKALQSLFKQLRELWRRLEEGTLEPVDFFTQLDGLMGQLGAILRDEVVPAGRHDEDGADEEDEDTGSPSSTPSTDPSDAATPASPEPTSTPPATPQPTPTP